MQRIVIVLTGCLLVALCQGPALAAESVRMVARHSGLCLDIAQDSKHNGARLVQGNCSESEGQVWGMEAVAGGAGVMLRSRHSGLCLTVPSLDTTPGTAVIQWSCHGRANQQWIIEPSEEGYVQLRATHSTQCLDVVGGSKKPGEKVVQWPCDRRLNQQWRLDLVL